MTIKGKRVESREKPVEVDLNASKNGVYIRQNIVEEIREDEKGDKYTVYCYDEKFLTHVEYERYLITNDVITNIELKHESDIIDNYTLQLIEEGIL